MWPTGIHEDIIDDSFPSLPEHIRDEIKKRGTYVDREYFWDTDKHAMRDIFQSVENAQGAMDAFIKEHMDRFKLEGDYFQLGMALHPVMDSTSPMHRGEFLWWEPAWWILDILFEMSISDEQMQLTIDKIHETMCRYSL